MSGLVGPWKVTAPSTLRSEWHPDRRHAASSISAQGFVPYVPVMYFTTWFAAWNLPIASALMPGA